MQPGDHNSGKGVVTRFAECKQVIQIIGSIDSLCSTKLCGSKVIAVARQHPIHIPTKRRCINLLTKFQVLSGWDQSHGVSVDQDTQPHHFVLINMQILKIFPVARLLIRF